MNGGILKVGSKCYSWISLFSKWVGNVDSNRGHSMALSSHNVIMRTLHKFTQHSSDRLEKISLSSEPRVFSLIIHAVDSYTLENIEGRRNSYGSVNDKTTLQH